MKSILILLSFFFVCTCYGQNRTIFPWGVWGYGTLQNESQLDEFAPYDIKGYHLNIRWKDFEPEENVFNWSVVDDKIDILMRHRLWFGVLFLVGQNSPEWIYKKVPRVVTSGHADTGPYPYYFDPDYVAAYLNLLKQVAHHITTYSSSVKSHLIYWQIAEGSTGDAQPYKGEPIDSRYSISDAQWTVFRRAAWDSVNVYAQGENKTYKFLFNLGIDAQDLEYAEARFPGNMNKDAWLAHYYSFDGELPYYSRQLRHLHVILRAYKTRAEAQQLFDFEWWKQAPVKQSFSLVCGALAGGLDIFNCDNTWFNKNITDTRPTDFFNKYARRLPTIDSKGFVALRDVIDFADIWRFPTSIYGPVVDPSRQDEYKRAIKSINNDAEDSAIYKYWQKIQTTARYLNPERVSNLVNQYKDSGALYNTEGDMYHNDFGVGLAGNYFKYIYQMNERRTSAGVYRIGPDTSMYGRYGRKFKITDGHGEMYFSVNDSLFVSPTSPLSSPANGVKTFKVQISVVYYDTANGEWAITNGLDKAFQFKNKGTRQWKQVTVQFDSFVLNNAKSLPSGADFSLKYINGANTPFALIEIDNLDKGSNCPEYQDIISRQGRSEICEGDTVKLDALPRMYSYAWSTGDTTRSIFVTTEGNYAVTIQDSSGCIARSDSVFIRVYPAPHTTIEASGAISQLCPGKTVRLSSLEDYKYYMWNNDSTTQGIRVTAPGDYWVRVENKQGCVSFSDTVTVTYEPCSKPTDLFTNNIKVDKVTLNWTKADTCALSYNIQYRVSGTSNWTTLQLSNTNTKVIDSLQPGTAYEWGVETVCTKEGSSSIVSGYINGQNFTTLSCETATDLFVNNIHLDRVTLNWTQVPAGAKSYDLQYREVGAENWTTLQLGNTNTKQIASLKNGTVYEWRVETICSRDSNLTIGSGYTSGPNFRTLSCAIPIDLFVDNIKPDLAGLNWTQVSEFAPNYQIQYREVGTENWTTLKVGTISSKQIDSLKPGTTYEWSIETICDNNPLIESGYVNGPNFTTLSCETATDLFVNDIQLNKVTLNWTQVPKGATNYLIQYREVGAENWTTLKVGAIGSKQIVSLKPGTIYEWSLETACKGDLSIVSGYVKGPNFTTISCKTPTDLFVDNIKPDLAILNWTQAPEGAISYQVQYREVGTENWTIKKPGNTDKMQVSSLKPGTEYEWGVETICKNDLSIVSGYVEGPNFTTVSCEAPTDLFVDKIKPDKATLNWTQAPVGAAKYQIQYREAGAQNWITELTGNTSKKQINSLKPGTQYEWGVETVCKGDLSVTSGYSNGPQFTTVSGFIAKENTITPQNLITSTKLNVVLYPNPTSGSAILSISGEAGSVSIAIADYTGKILWQKINTNEKQMHLSVGKFAPGVYMVIVMNRSEKKVIKFIKQ